MASSALRLGLLAGWALASAACPAPSEVFTCASDADCTGEGVGACQSNGFCAFPDAMCASGSRYGGLAGGGFADMCVPEDDGSGTGTSTTPSTTGTATATPETTTSSTTTGQTSVAESTSTQDESTQEASGSTTGSDACASYLFDDDFDGNFLGAGWEFAGKGVFDVDDGSLDLTPTPIAGDQPTWIRRTAPVDFVGAWFRVEIDDLPVSEPIQGIVSLTHQNGIDSFDIVVERGAEQIIARSWNEGGYADLQIIPFEKSESPWVGLREEDGNILFERGTSEGTLTPFFTLEADISTWVATLYLGADNYVDLPESDDVRFGRAAACGPA